MNEVILIGLALISFWILLKPPRNKPVKKTNRKRSPQARNRKGLKMLVTQEEKELIQELRKRS